MLLDNCEHLVSACAELVSRLVHACPRMRILATSRETLSIPGETVWQVHYLSLPDLKKQLTLDQLLQSEALRLFVERALASKPDFELTDNLAEKISQICLQLEGVPLAIELAAPWIRILSPDQISGRLQQSFDLLAGVKRNSLPHQKTMRGTIDWSYNLLTEQEKALFRRLAIFDGPFRLDDVESICTDPEGNFYKPDDSPPSVPLRQAEILRLLYHLIDKSLILVNQNFESFFSMLGIVRQYANEILQASGERIRFKERFVVYYLHFAEQAELKITGPEVRTWLNLLEGEHDNLRSALMWLYEQNDGERGLRLASALNPFWKFHAYFDEGSRWLRKMLDLGSGSDLYLLKGYVKASELAENLGHYTEGINYAIKALEICQELQDKQGMAEALFCLGKHANAQGDRQKGVGFLEESLGLYRVLEDDIKQGWVLLYLADTRLRLGELDRAKLGYEEALSIFQLSGEINQISFALGGLGDIARMQGNFPLATSYFSEALTNYRHIGNKFDVVFILEAQAILSEALGQHECAACLWGATEALREATHLSLAPSYQQDYAVYIDRARKTLGEKAYASAWAQGRRFTMDEAIEFALSTAAQTHVPEALKPIKDSKPISDLTPREMDVLRLLATGLTDSQIAAQLFLSRRTVSKHLQSIYSKIHVSSRSAATYFASEHKLV